jgi:hypothetical protein
LLRQTIRAAALLLPGVAILFAACSESPTGQSQPESPVRSEASPRSGFRGNPTAGPDPRYVCYRSEATPQARYPFQYRRFAVRFPAEALATDGRTLIYSVRLVSGGVTVAMANCRIPRTPQAIALMDRRLDVDDRRRTLLRLDGSCGSSSDPCSVAGVTGTATYPSGDSGDWGWGSWSDWGSSMGDGYSGGSTYDPGTPTFDGSDLNEDLCPAQDPSCNVPLSETDKQTLGRAMQTIKRDADPVCAQLADKLQQMIDNNSVYRGAYDSGHTGGATASAIHVDPRFWDNANSEGGGWDEVLASALLHETAHTLYPDHVGETQTPYHTFPYDHMFNPDSGVPQCA